MDDIAEEDPGFVQRHSGLIFIAIVVVVAPAIFFGARKISGGRQSSRHQDEIIVRLPPPPPPLKPRATPTPEAKPTPEDQPKMVEQNPREQQLKPEPPKEKPSEALGTSIKGPGDGGAFSLGSGTGEGSQGSGGSGGSKYGWYGNQVKNRIAEAVRNNSRTRKASMNIVIRIWPDSTGRITKVRIADSNGDTALDTTLQNDILTGLRLAESPPAGMPLPIVMRLIAQRPQ